MPLEILGAMAIPVIVESAATSQYAKIEHCLGIHRKLGY